MINLVWSAVIYMIALKVRLPKAEIEEHIRSSPDESDESDESGEPVAAA